MRWPRERAQTAMPDEEDMAVEDERPPGRLGEIEVRITQLAERFDQLEFVIVEQFEPGMTAAGELPSGNLRDRLDRIEAALGLLRRDPPDAAGTWADAMTSGAEVLDVAVLEARLDEIAARLTDLAHGAKGPQVFPEAFEALEKRLQTFAEEAAARHDGYLSAVTAEVAARDAALQAVATAQDAGLTELRAALTAEMDARQTALLAAFPAPVESQGLSEAAVEAITGRVVREAAERAEARLETTLTEMEAREAAVLAAFRSEADAQRKAIAEAFADEAAARDAAAAAALAAAEGAQTAVAAEFRTRHDAILAMLERAMNRPPPAPDLTQQHRSFAGFATALQTTLNQFELSVDAILDRLDGMARRLEAVEARIAAPVEAREAAIAAAPVSGLETSIGALSDGIGALVEVLGQRAAPAREPSDPDTLMFDRLGALVTAAVDEAARGSQGAMDATLRDLRLAMAELAADSQRLRIA
jgi:hypothetical protein